MFEDKILLDKLVDTGKIHDTRFLVSLDDVLKKPRILDKAPDTIKLKKHDNVAVCGIRSDYLALYSSNFNHDKVNETATLELDCLNRGTVMCDYEVWLTLKTLMFLSISKSLARAEACKAVFLEILKIPGVFIAKSDLFKALSEMSGTYEIETVSSAVLEACCTKEEQAMFYILCCLGNCEKKKEYADALYAMCDIESLDSVKKSIKSIYSQAKKCGVDKLYPKNLESRELCAAVYLTEMSDALVSPKLKPLFKDVPMTEFLDKLNSMSKGTTLVSKLKYLESNL